MKSKGSYFAYWERFVEWWGRWVPLGTPRGKETEVIFTSLIANRVEEGRIEAQGARPLS